MYQPLCTRQKPTINFTEDWVGLGAGLGVRNMSLPSESDHLAHSDSLYRRKYSGHRENIVTVIRVFPALNKGKVHHQNREICFRYVASSSLC